MAQKTNNKLRIHAENGYSENTCLSDTDYTSDTQRSAGMKAGEQVKSKVVNTGMREATLVSTALIDVALDLLNDSSTVIQPSSTLDNVKNLLRRTFDAIASKHLYNHHITVTVTKEGSYTAPVFGAYSNTTYSIQFDLDILLDSSAAISSISSLCEKLRNGSGSPNPPHRHVNGSLSSVAFNPIEGQTMNILRGMFNTSIYPVSSSVLNLNFAYCFGSINGANVDNLIGTINETLELNDTYTGVTVQDFVTTVL